CIFMPCQYPDELAACIAGSPDNSSFYHLSSIPFQIYVSITSDNHIPHPMRSKDFIINIACIIIHLLCILCNKNLYFFAKGLETVRSKALSAPQQSRTLC